MTRADPIGVGVVGLGFMGRTHLEAYRSANEAGEPNRIVAVCDAKASSLTGDRGPAGNLETVGGDGPAFDVDSVFGTTDVHQLLARDDVELVSICTPTDSHVDLACARARGRQARAGREAGRDLDVAEAERLARARRATSDRVCMPAMCIRFWPGLELAARARVETGDATAR